LEGDLVVAALSVDDLHKMCEALEDILGPERHVTCNGQVLTYGGPDYVEKCVTHLSKIPNCPATVVQSEYCEMSFSAQTDEQICSTTFIPDGCDFLATPPCEEPN
jgi:hypothetical protein